MDDVNITELRQNLPAYLAKVRRSLFERSRGRVLELGVGTGNFTYVYPEMNSPLLAGRDDLLRYQGLWTNAAHNEKLYGVDLFGSAVGALVVAAYAILCSELTASAWWSALSRC